METLCTSASLDTRIGMDMNAILRTQATISHKEHVFEYADVRNPNIWL